MCYDLNVKCPPQQAHMCWHLVPSWWCYSDTLWNLWHCGLAGRSVSLEVGLEGIVHLWFQVSCLLLNSPRCEETAQQAAAATDGAAFMTIMDCVP